VASSDASEALGPIAEGVILNEVFESYKSAGFTDAQALWLTAAIATGNPGMPPDGVIVKD
jgi:hypothetical protein